MDESRLPAFRKKVRKIRDAAFEVGVENRIIKGEVQKATFTLETVRRERDALRTTVRGLRRRVALMTWALAHCLGFTVAAVLFIGRQRGWW